MNDIILNADERLDDLHRNGYCIIQNPSHFCFGVDAVLLSGFVKAYMGEVVLDLCTGTGVIPILLAAKTQASHFTGIDIQKEVVDMAKRSVSFNNLSDRIEILEADVKSITDFFKPSSFDVITSNPPYISSGGGLINNISKKAIARHEILCSLNDIVFAASKLLKTGGRFYMIHRPHRLTDIIVNLRNFKLEPKFIRFIHPYLSKEPTMLLIEAVRGAKAMVKILPPLIIYQDNGEYTKEVYKIYYE